MDLHRFRRFFLNKVSFFVAFAAAAAAAAASETVTDRVHSTNSDHPNSKVARDILSSCRNVSRPSNCSAENHHTWLISPYSANCISCQYSKINGLEPDVEALAKYPGRPWNLTTKIYYYQRRANPVSCWQVLNITWKMPQDESTRNVTGFWLNVSFKRHFANKMSNVRRKFTVNGDLLFKDGSYKDLVFYYDCLELYPATKYRIQLFSLPLPPSWNSSDNPHQEELPLTETSLTTSCDEYPESDDSNSCAWKSEDVKLVKIEIGATVSLQLQFKPAPDVLGFDGYNVTLKRNGIILSEAFVYFTCKDYLPIIFKNVCPGDYEGFIKPFKRNQMCTCMSSDECQGQTSHPGHKSYSIHINASEVSGPCYDSLEVVVPLMTVLSSEQMIEMTITSSVDAVVQSSFELKTRNDEVLIVTVIGCTSALAILLLIFIVLMVWRRQSSSQTGSSFSIPKRPVLLIYARDNDLHCNVVRCLATYLEKICRCDVKFDEWFSDEISQKSALEWMIGRIKAIDDIIIIDSESGFHKTNAQLEGRVFERQSHETVAPDMFVPAIRLLLQNKNLIDDVHRKYFKLIFSYTDPRFSISKILSGKTYHMMKNIDDLFLDIHRLSRYTRNGMNAVKEGGINASKFMCCMEGRNLEKAVKEAGAYFEKNSNWFCTLYREIRKTEAERLQTKDEEENQEDSGIGLTRSLMCMNDIPEFVPPDDSDSESIDYRFISSRADSLNKHFDLSLSKSVL